MGNTSSRQEPHENVISLSDVEPVVNSRRSGTLSDIGSLRPKRIQEKITIEEHLTNNDNNQSLALIRNQLDSYKGSSDFPPKTEFNRVTPLEQDTAASSWDVSGALAKSYKLLNLSSDTLKKADYANKEKKALSTAVSNNVVLANKLAAARSMLNVNTQTRIAEINNAAFRQKQILVNRLMYVIFFILYAIGLGLAMASGFITMRMLSIAFSLGLIYLVYSLLVSESFWKTYGDISMGIAKEAVKEIVTTVGPVKKCPARCVTKSSYVQHDIAKPSSSVVDQYDPICEKQGGDNADLYPYDYDSSDLDFDSRNFRDCEIGKMDKCKDGRPLSFVCKWDSGLRPDGEQLYINSSVPCHYYNNRIEVNNERN